MGGGYPKHALSDVAFAWMAQEAAKVGLQLDAPPPKDTLPSAPVVLHHEVRRLFALSKPTVRDALLHRDRLEARTLETFRIHPSVLQRLVADPAPHYDFPRPQINTILGTVDALSLQLHLELRFNPSGAPATSVPEWLKAVRLDEVAGCADRVRTFLAASGSPSEPEREGFVRSFCLWMLLDEGDVTKVVADLVESTGASLEARFLHPDPNLRVLGEWLRRLKEVPTDLKRAEPLLPPHRHQETAALAGRLDQLFRRLNGDAVALAADPRTWTKR